MVFGNTLNQKFTGAHAPMVGLALLGILAELKRATLPSKVSINFFFVSLTPFERLNPILNWPFPISQARRVVSWLCKKKVVFESYRERKERRHLLSFVVVKA